jgi:tetratricopeptide (TPR) repeat protein
MDPRLPAAAVLLASGAAAAGAAERCRETPRPPPGASSVLGGFTALAAQAAWIQAERAIVQRDEDRAVVLLRTLVRLEPQVAGAARYAAQEIGWNMLQGRDDPAVRGGLVREALSILDACVEANPGSAEALRNRGRYVLLRLAGDDALAAAARRPGDRRPLDSALDDLARAFDLAPDDSETTGLLGAAARRAAVERTAAGSWTAAAEACRRAVTAYDRVLADAREQLGAEIDAPGPARESFRATQAARDALRDLCVALEAPPDARDARLEQVRRDHPELGL